MNETERTHHEFISTDPQIDNELLTTLPETSDQPKGVEDRQPENQESAPAEVERLDKLRAEIKDHISQPPAHQHETDAGLPAETITQNGHSYTVKYVPKEQIYPAFGRAGGNVALVRQDLSPRVRKFVRTHELYHCQDTATWGGEFGSEIRANIVPGLKDPLGLAATVWKTITNKDRMRFYFKRFIKR
jgi:hypothetical protein